MSIRDLSFSYQDRPLDTVLSHLDLDIFEGECLAILGASGSGKTTLLKLLCGLMRPD
ncbi:MAG TPA: sulfonate ABC transporter ATP-binding protein, partial [Sarcina sp.]|nr:sulfonate ABC transporter ATP-binding protein [Sarcina sp.]